MLAQASTLKEAIDVLEEGMKGTTVRLCDCIRL